MEKALLVIRDYDTYEPFDYILVNKTDVLKAHKLIEDYDTNRYDNEDEWDYNEIFEILENNGIKYTRIYSNDVVYYDL